MKVSIIIINYNYARFLKDSINHSLQQSYKNLEIIVVDDGSTDNSRSVIAKYGDLLITVFQQNNGMMAAANAGFEKATGDIIIFLDADDYLYKNAVSKIVAIWREGVSKIHFRLQKIDSNGQKIGVFPPSTMKLSRGEVWLEILKYGSYVTPPMSGNAFSRNILQKIFPVTDSIIADSHSYFDKIPTDSYLKFRVPFWGPILAINEPLGIYRIHGDNGGAGTSPYFNQGKRMRHLKLAKMNAVFIAKQLQKREMTWNEDNLFRKNKLMVLRVLSFRFDKNHIWNEDTLSSLLKKFATLFNAPSKDGFLRKTYNLLILMLLLFISRKQAELLLKFIHPKAFVSKITHR